MLGRLGWEVGVGGWGGVLGSGMVLPGENQDMVLPSCFSRANP
jgi:hypothetical protein